MNERKDDKWLDELISRTINTEKPEFDAGKWKQKFPDEFQALQSRATDKSTHSSKRPILLKSPVVKFAAAAAIIIVTGLLTIRPAPDKKVDIVKVTNTTKSPAEMLTTVSLMGAYRRGGIDAVNKQCEEAIEKLGTQPAKMSLEELLAEFNGT
jgi:hypothetical protein